MSLTHRSLLSCPYCVDTQNPLLSSRLMCGSSGYRARYFFRNPPSKSARTPSMSTRTRSLLPEEEEDDMFTQILLNGSRSKVFPLLPSRRVVLNSNNIVDSLDRAAAAVLIAVTAVNRLSKRRVQTVDKVRIGVQKFSKYCGS